MKLAAYRDFNETLEQLRSNTKLQQLKPYVWKFSSDEIEGLVYQKVEKGFEFRIWQWKSFADITFVRKAMETDVWNLNLVVGRGVIQSTIPGLKLSEGVILNSELHNIKSDAISTFVGPAEILSASFFIDTSWMKRFASGSKRISQILDQTKPLGYFDVISQSTQQQLHNFFELELDDPFHEELIRNGAEKLLLFKMSKFWKRIESSKTIQIHEAFVKRMMSARSLFADFHRPPTLDDISKFVGLNQTKTNQLFKQVYGQTPYQFFNEQRLNEAYQLILNSNLQISEIGVRLGFASMSHFSQVFAKRFSILPKKLQLQRNDFQVDEV